MAALGEDAAEEFFAGFEFSVFGFGEFGFGGDEAAFAGGFEDGGAVAFEVGLHPPQRRHPRLQPRELLLNLRHNPPLFGKWGDRNLETEEHREFETLNGRSRLCAGVKDVPLEGLQCKSEII